MTVLINEIVHFYYSIDDPLLCVNFEQSPDKLKHIQKLVGFPQQLLN